MKTTEVIEVSVIETALAKENITNKVIAKLKSDYMLLTINGLDDKKGFDAVETARKECKSLRVLAAKICKSGREEAIKIQKEWIEKEKEVIGEISIVEDYLESQSNKIKEEERRILFEAAQRSKLPIRKDKLMSIGIEVQDEELLKINDDQFNALFNEFYEKHLAEKEAKLRAEQEKIDAEKREAQRIEDERLAELKRLKDIEDAKDKARIDAENKAKAEIEQKEKERLEAIELANKLKLEAEQKAKDLAEQVEREKREAIVKAEAEKQAAILKLKQDQEAKETAELKAKQEAIELELSKGDKAKFETIISDLQSLKSKYEFKSKKHQQLGSDVNTLIDKIVTFINSKL